MGEELIDAFGHKLASSSCKNLEFATAQPIKEDKSYNPENKLSESNPIYAFIAERIRKFYDKFIKK